MSELERALHSNDINLVKKVISDMEYEYYTVDNGEELKDYFEDFEYIVPNYDTLLKAMGIDDNQEPKVSEMYSDEVERKMDKVDAFESPDFINLYFIRMEQYALADEDATISRVIYTDNIEKAVQDCMKLLAKRNIVLEYRILNQKKNRGIENGR